MVLISVIAIILSFVVGFWAGVWVYAWSLLEKERREKEKDAHKEEL